MGLEPFGAYGIFGVYCEIPKIETQFYPLKTLSGYGFRATLEISCFLGLL